MNRKNTSKPLITAPRKRGKTDWAAVDQITETEIAAAVAADPDAAPILDKEWFAKARIHVPEKTPIYIRVDSDVLAYFKEIGPRYQTRINEVLRAYVSAHKESTNG